jgi:hypothetical protein
VVKLLSSPTCLFLPVLWCSSQKIIAKSSVKFLFVFYGFRQDSCLGLWTIFVCSLRLGSTFICLYIGPAIHWIWRLKSPWVLRLSPQLGAIRRWWKLRSGKVLGH